MFSIGDTLDTLIKKSAESYANKIAITCGQDKITYKELQRRVEMLSYYLKEIMQMPNEARIGIYMDRGINLVITMIATFAASYQYVPLDPSYPGERVSYIYKDGDLSVVFCDGRNNFLQVTIHGRF